ncbi:MAG: RNA polymerase sigma factor [Verrucomicrobia subdivision 3 bacterium]|nr:RNA polymerase sigma factor [Limisphaerales bacterium]
MSSQPSEPDIERLQLRKFQEGDPEALGWLRTRFNPVLMNILVARGATAIEAEELLADMWGDCVPGSEDRPSLLDKFSNQCPLQNWLATVATRRWIDLKRRQNRRREAAPSGSEDTDVFARMESPPAMPTEHHLITLLRDSLRAAFDHCPAGDMLMLRLVYLHGISQREVGRMWGWHESKISRRLSEAMKNIETHTLRCLQEKDPWLKLAWQDFLDLCQTHQIGFL